MICQFKISEFCDLGLKFLNRLILKFFYLAALHTDQVVMVISAVQFKDRITAFKVMAHNQTGGFKLRENAVNRGEPDFFTFADQGLEDVFGAEVLNVVGTLQDFENLDAGQGDFKSCVPDIFAFQRELLPGVKVALIGYDDKLIKANSSYHAAISLCWSGPLGRDPALWL